MRARVKKKVLLSTLIAGLGLIQPVKAAVTFSVTPAAVSNTYNGTITLQIGGLTNTETVVIQKFLDLNTNGIIDGKDWLVQQFTLTDGQAGMVIGGVTNVNVPGDTDGTANGQITTPLNFQNGDIVQNIVGNYLYKLSSPVGHFTPITNQFAVTNFPYAQKFTGNVVSNGTSITVSNAVVLLLQPEPFNGGPLEGVVANNAGSYTMLVPPGTYSLVAVSSNSVANMGTPPVLTLSSGQTLTTNLTVIHATNNISGKLVDSSNSSIGLPGVLMLAQASGLIGIAFTDTNGNFNLPVNAGDWGISPSSDALLVHGHVGLNNGTNVNVGATNVTLAVPKATALIYGSIKDNLGNPFPELEADTDDSSTPISVGLGLYETESFTDANGNYVLGVVGGTNDSWWMEVNGDNQLTNYVFTPDHHNGYVSINAGQVVLWNITGILGTNHITGWLKDNNGNPITGVEIYASAMINGLAYDQEMDTDNNGNYWLNVPNGSWDVQVAPSYWGSSDSLPTNYIVPPDQYPVIANSNAVVDFTATLLPLQVTTVALPNGTNGFAYSQQLSAAYGKLPYSWTNSSGVLPPGLTMATNGLISGTPTNNGTFNFTVKVADALFTNAMQSLAVTVGSPPSATLQPTNTSVTVTTGNNVTLAVSVSGTGPFTYQWQLNGTNLPNGIITTVAGNGGYGGPLGDGGAATNAELYHPKDVVVDVNGNLFIADYDNGRIRKVGTNGIITTVVGGGGYYPAGVAVDTTGNLFFADWGNNVIRKVGTNGIITTVAGGGANGLGDGGAATNAELNSPADVAVDPTGDLLIADMYNQRIRKVGTNGIITTVAGGGANGLGDGGAATNAELNFPSSVAMDPTGNLFIADNSNQRIRRVGTNGIITTVAGNGTGGYSGDGSGATKAELFEPSGVALDATGNLFFSDSYNNVIRKVGTTGIITTVAGNGYDAGTDYGGYSGDGGAATNAELYYPEGVVVDINGNLFIADTYNNRIRKVVIQGPTLILQDVGVGNAGAYDVVVSSPYGSVTSSVVNLIIGGAPLQITTASLPNATNGMTYSQTLSASGGQLPYSWTKTSGGLPPGLALATNGVISGIPTIAGTSNFTVKVTDATNGTAIQSLTLTVLAPNLVLNGGFETGNFSGWITNGHFTSTAVVTGAAYAHSGTYGAELGPVGSLGFISQTLATTAGTSYLLSCWLDSPDGETPNEFLVSWNGNKLLDETNIPAIGWTNIQFVVTATTTSTVLQFGFWDDPSFLGLDDISVVASGPAQLAITTTALSNGTNGLAYTQQLFAVYGQTPYSWTNSSGALPPGLTLTTNGVISGTPTNSGTFNFTVEVTDAMNSTATQALALTIILVDTNPPVLTIISPTSGQCWSNAVFTVTGTATDNVAVASVFYSLNNAGWNSAVTANGWTNWTAMVTLVPGTNTISAYAVDTSGDFSTTNRVSFDFVVNTIKIALVNPDYYRGLKCGEYISTNYYSIANGSLAQSGTYWAQSWMTNTANWTGLGLTPDYLSGLLTNAGYQVDIYWSSNFPSITTSSYNLVIVQDPLTQVGQQLNPSVETNAPDVLNNPVSTAFLTNLEAYYNSGGAVLLVGNAVRLLENGTNRLNFGKQVIAKNTPNSVTTASARIPGHWLFAMGAPFCCSSRSGAGSNFVQQSSIVSPGGLVSQVSLAVGNDYAMGEVWCETIYYPSDAVSLLDVNVKGTAQYVLDGSTCSPTIDQDSVNWTNQDYMGYSMVNGRKIYFVGSDSFFNLQFTDNLGAWHCANPETIQSQVGSAGTNAILGLVSLAVTIPPPLIILSAPQLTVGKTNFAFLLSGPAGSNYVLQVSTNLLNWSSVSTSTIPVNGSITLSNAIGGYKQSFYRVLMQ